MDSHVSSPKNRYMLKGDKNENRDLHWGSARLAVMLTTVLCLWSVLSPSVTNATVYHVATTGNDSRSCTTAQAISTPKATIVSGITCLSAGDTLYIRQGTYISENLDTTRINIPSGTSWSNPVTIAGYPGETVIMLREKYKDMVVQ